MNSKKLPSCLGVAAVVGLSTTPAIVKLAMLLMKSGDIVNNAKKIKDEFDKAMRLSKDINNDYQSGSISDDKYRDQMKEAYDNISDSVFDFEVNSDMG